MSSHLHGQTTGSAAEGIIKDGPMDVTTNTQHMRLDAKEMRRHQYAKFVDTNKQLVTAAGNVIPFSMNLNRANIFHIQVRKWLKDGQVAVAHRPCSCCVEINSLRPQFKPAFCCLVRAKYKLESTDGTAACAMCYATGNFKCSARAYFPQISNAVGRKNSLDSLTAASRRTGLMAANSINNSTTHLLPPLPDLPSQVRSEILESVDEMYGEEGTATAAPFGTRLKASRSSTSIHNVYPHPSIYGSQDTTYDREMRPATAPSGGGAGPRRPLSESSHRRRARFVDGTLLGAHPELLELLSSRMDELQRASQEQAETTRVIDGRVRDQMEQLRDLQRRSELHSEQMNRLQNSRQDQSNVNYHLSRLVEVVDELHRSISEQKREIQTLKQSSSSSLASAFGPTPSNNIIPFPSTTPSTTATATTAISTTAATLDELRKFIDENDERQRQRKAVYLDHLNRELQRTLHDIPSTAIDKVDVLTRRSDNV